MGTSAIMDWSANVATAGNVGHGDQCSYFAEVWAILIHLFGWAKLWGLLGNILLLVDCTSTATFCAEETPMPGQTRVDAEDHVPSHDMHKNWKLESRTHQASGAKACRALNQKADLAAGSRRSVV